MESESAVRTWIHVVLMSSDLNSTFEGPCWQTILIIISKLGLIPLNFQILQNIGMRGLFLRMSIKCFKFGGSDLRQAILEDELGAVRRQAGI